MEIIITAGPTFEAIDSVRSITNEATGALGRMIAEKLIEKGGKAVTKIDYICDRTAKKPELSQAEVCLVRGVKQTAETLDRLLRTRPVAAVIHSMAVSDYTIASAVSPERLADALFDRLKDAPLTREDLRDALCRAALHEVALPRGQKLSSDMESLFLLLERAPKIIRNIKTLSPDTLLVGFKLLDRVPLKDLFAAAEAQFVQNGCDLVLANDLDSIRRGEHTGYLLDRTHAVEKAVGKEAIASLIAEKVLEAVKAKGESK